MTFVKAIQIYYIQAFMSMKTISLHLAVFVYLTLFVDRANSRIRPVRLWAAAKNGPKMAPMFSIGQTVFIHGSD